MSNVVALNPDRWLFSEPILCANPVALTAYLRLLCFREINGSLPDNEKTLQNMSGLHGEVWRKHVAEISGLLAAEESTAQWLNVEYRKRSSLGGLRFRVLRRDNFTCQYCGRSAPDVELHVDHKVPFADGGSDSLSNLVTACAECNLGKSDSPAEDV